VPEHKNDALPYMQRTRDYYLKLGYGAPYKWAHYDTVPFAPMRKPLADCRVAIVTTAAPYRADKGDQGPDAPLNADAKFFSVYYESTASTPDLRISHIAIDRDHTYADDLGAYFPLEALHAAAKEKRIKEVGPHFYGLPTNRSKRTTIDTDCVVLTNQCNTDGVDIALLVPNCPVCHQSVSLAARALEEAGIVSVVMGCAKDIVENVGVPRFVFNDFPLGNSAGIPHNKRSQTDILHLALTTAESATKARTTVQSPFQWEGKSNWKDDYSNADKLTEAEIIKRKRAFDEGKAIAKRKRQNSKTP
jgi:hypothetical protein